VAFDIAEIRQNMAVLSERLARVREQEEFIKAMQTHTPTCRQSE
jgi:hypothetical protein